MILKYKVAFICNICMKVNQLRHSIHLFLFYPQMLLSLNTLRRYVHMYMEKKVVIEFLPILDMLIFNYDI